MFDRFMTNLKSSKLRTCLTRVNNFEKTSKLKTSKIGEFLICFVTHRKISFLFILTLFVLLRMTLANYVARE